MSDDDTESEQSEEEQMTTDNRDEREHRREEQNPSEGGSTGTDPDALNPSDSSDGSDSTLTGTGKDVEQLDVPQIPVNSQSRFDTIDQVDDTPSNDLTVDIPQVRLHSPSSFGPTDSNLGEAIFIETESSIVEIPQFTTENSGYFVPEELDDTKLEGVKYTQQVRIPQITVDRPHRIKPFEAFPDTIPDITVRTSPTEIQAEESTDELTEDREVEAIKRDRKEVSSLDEHEDSDLWINDEWPDPLKLIFGSGGEDLRSDNPIIILVDDNDLIGVVETVVKRLYREKEGGEPDLTKFNTAEQLADEERWVSADSRIFTAELSDKEWDKIGNEDDYQDEWRSIWQNRIDQLFSGQQFGAIVFNRSEIPGPEVKSRIHHIPTIVELEGEIPWSDIVNVFWHSKPENSERTFEFSQWFDRDARGVAKDRWKQIVQAADGKFTLATERDDAASDDHYALKVFIVKWIAEKLWRNGKEFAEYDDILEIDYREIEQTIRTEYSVTVTDGNTIKPDVKYGSDVFEAELFFGEADESGVISKLQQTVRKYENVGGIEKINIVVDNLTCLLHIKDLAQFKRNHHPWEQEYADITFYTIDLAEEALVPLTDVVGNIKTISSN